MRAIFLEHARSRAAEISDLPALDAHLARAVHAAITSWPDLALPRPDFVAAVGDRFASDRAALDVWFSRLQAQDLFLAVAVSEGIPLAADAFSRLYREEIARAVRRYEGPRQPVDDLVQIVLEKLIVGAGPRKGKLCEYGGQGPLSAWLKVVAARTAIDAVKGGAQQRREHGVEDLAAAASAQVGDVDLDFLKRDYQSTFKEAFAEAIGELPPEERTLLRMSALRGMGIDEIGTVFHVHRATAARRLARVRESLLLATRAKLCARLSVRDDEIDSVLGLIESRMEVSLERLLRSTMR